jgi:single-stranded-DNA-specific exonuclease
MLTTDDSSRASLIASELDRCNARRQEIERLIVDEALELIEAQGDPSQRSAIVLGRQGWHAGVIGIVAARLAERYHRPAVVITLGDDVAQGSARSIPGFDLYEALKDCSDLLVAYGGHAAAAGLKLLPDQLPAFTRRFEERCRSSLSPEQLERSLVIDAEIPLDVLSIPVVAEIEKLEPHGISNPRPLFLSSNLEVVGEPRLVGEKKDHLQLRFRQGSAVFKAIAWNQGEKMSAIKSGCRCSAVFTPSINEWHDRRDVQLEIKDLIVDHPDGGPFDQVS